MKINKNKLSTSKKPISNTIWRKNMDIKIQKRNYLDRDHVTCPSRTNFSSTRESGREWNSAPRPNRTGNFIFYYKKIYECHFCNKSACIIKKIPCGHKINGALRFFCALRYLDPFAVPVAEKRRLKQHWSCFEG